MTDLSVAKRDLLEQEVIIERHLEGFVQVGIALSKIRDQRLYKVDGFKSFETYCRERWKMSRSYADKQIKAAHHVLETEDDRPQNITRTEWAVRNHLAAIRPAPVDVAPEVRKHLEEHTAEPEVIYIDHEQDRCDVLMQELAANPRLAILVHKALMKWYALNT